MFKSNNQTGYTLIELLLYVTIVSSLLLAVTMFFSMSAEGQVKNQTVSEVDQQGTFALNYIAQTLRNATAITSPAMGASANQITVTVPTASLSPTIFNLSGTALHVKEGTAAAVPLTSDTVQISNLTFKNLSRSSTNEIVQVSFTVSGTNTSGRNEYDYQKTFTTSAALR